jgi:hypothetical protein
MLVALLVAAASAASPVPVAARVEAHATVRIVRGTAIRFERANSNELPAATTRTVRESDGAITLARVVEFQ